MTAPAFVTVQMVRDTIDLNADATSRYSDGTISSNIRAASTFLERRTGRWFAPRTGTTWTLTTGGKVHLPIPGFRTVSSVVRGGSTLEADSTYWLIPDAMQTGLYTGIQFRGYRSDYGPWYLSVPDWFDRNLDHPYWQQPGIHSSLPNDLVITGDGGFVVGTEPDDLLTATRLLAAHLTVYPDAVLGGGSTTEQGSPNELAGWPPFVLGFIRDWSLAGLMVAQT